MARSSYDSDDDEDFVVLGTPLPELDEREGPKKPITVQDLTAKDKEGRRRFHGAFTGGFSAGYFNSVGSKEGFTPSTFVSSRSQKNDESNFSRPEEFMDDEDLEEHGIAPRKFATAKNYTSEERKRKFEDLTKGLTKSSPLDIGAALGDLFVPEYLPIGIKLLRKMGWREGQGVGARVKKKSKRGRKKTGKAGGKKIYGCALPPSDSDSSDSDSFVPANMSDLTFAPSDVTPISLSAKDDVKGLGYRGLDPSLALPGSHINLFSQPVRDKKRGQGIKGHAFGVGALEEDDDDIYAQDSMANYDMTMRDGDDDRGDRDTTFGWTAPRAHGKQTVPVSYVGKLLEGFCLSSKPLQPGKKFPPPNLPSNFKPYHWSRRRKIEDAAAGNRNRMTAVDRGLLLGETPVMESVFDLVSAKDKSRISHTQEAIAMTKSLAMKQSSQQADTTTPPSSVNNEETKPSTTSNDAPSSEDRASKFMSRFTPANSCDTIADFASTVDKPSSDSAATKPPLFQGSLSLQPFRKDPPKQARYDVYVAAVKQGVPEPYGEVSSSFMTEWERAKERDEFSRSARLFRPMSAMMATRFVEGSMLDDKNQDSKNKDTEAPSDEVKAAEMKMFGKLTRQEFEWHPDKLICRRFNVPNPYPGSDIIGLPDVKRDKYSIFNFLSMGVGDFRPSETAHIPEPDVSKPADKEPSKDDSLKRPGKKKATLASIFKVLDDPDFHKLPEEAKTDILEQGAVETLEKEEEDEEEPDDDLFRAIFKNSDSEDSEDEKNESEQEVDEDMSDDKDNDDEEEEAKKDKDGQSSVIPIPSESETNGARQIEQAGTSNRLPTDMEVEKSDNGQPSESENTATEGNDTQHVNAKTPKSDEQSAVKLRRFESRWGSKSVFSVLDEVNEETRRQKETEINEVSDEESYGPALPPSVASTPQTSTIQDGGAKKELKEESRHRPRSHQKEKHKHKKEKKKKSKHKKEKKPKKSKKSSKSKKQRADSSGSDGDTDSSGQESDVSDGELIQRWKQVSKSGRS